MPLFHEQSHFLQIVPTEQTIANARTVRIRGKNHCVCKQNTTYNDKKTAWIPIVTTPLLFKADSTK